MPTPAGKLAAPHGAPVWEKTKNSIYTVHCKLSFQMFIRRARRATRQIGMLTSIAPAARRAPTLTLPPQPGFQEHTADGVGADRTAIRMHSRNFARDLPFPPRGVAAFKRDNLIRNLFRNGIAAFR